MTRAAVARGWCAGQSQGVMGTTSGTLAHMVPGSHPPLLARADSELARN